MWFLVASLLIAFFSWHFYFRGREWALWQTALFGLMTLLIFVWISRGFHRKRPEFLLITGLGGLAPLLRVLSGGSAELSRLQGVYGPSIVWISMLLAGG